MAGIVEISAGLNSLKLAKDIVQAMHVPQTAVTINQIKLDLQSAILDAQQGLFVAQEAQSATAKRITELEQEIARLKDWSAEKERYELVNIWKGTVAYSEKAEVENRKPPHWLCANCFEQGRKSFIQWQGDMGPDAIYKCNGCGGTVTVDLRSKPK